ncbi:MAG: hypothetical protein IIU87_01590 [Prevotella sp.]|nr:hypothetical protein [Prevotella sp.]MBQ4633108.1 hypothetical protein [Prevotella sp.]MBQ5605883.1 hypothetical protein [Prevotella sp.]MBQ8628822.1 hypothetical protein [Prevotella sp.]MEE1091480.1 hypothetical protein [Prevotella sp.]
METGKKALTLKTLNKSNVWEIQENDIFRLLEIAEKDSDFKDNIRRYTEIIKCAFDVEEVLVDKPEVIAKYEARGLKVGDIRLDENKTLKWGIKKKSITRVTDLTYENIRHISAVQLLEVIDRNFGGGWDSLSQSIQDIIQSGFDISTTTLPKDRLHKPGGMYEKKIEDGFDVLEIEKGTWIEAIFAKTKPLTEKIHSLYDSKNSDNEDIDDEDEDIIDNNLSDDDDDYDEDMLTEESYRTTIEENPEELGLEVEDVADDDDF